MPKSEKKISKKRQKAIKAYRRVEPVMLPLLELFADVNDVMEEHDAFDQQNIYKGMGRIYRSWLDTREALDPEFDRARYRHEMKSRPKKSPLGRELPASTSPKSSTDRKTTSEKNPKRKGKQEKSIAKRSAKGAKSGGRASGGR